MRIIASFLLLAALVQAQPTPKEADVDRIFSAFNTHTPGCAVGVALHGSVVLKGGYGMADLERNVPITPDTIFESGSVAKQFTAAALLLLAQQGRISLDDPMRKYLPELPDYGMPVTIRQVLSHVSGLREWRAVGAFSGLPEDKLVYDNQDLLQLAARQRALNFEPGTDYSYTNTGFNISTILIERALGNGKTFQTFTREMIFEPLGMTHTRWRDDFRTVVPNRALSYERSKEDVWTQDTPIENIIGAGGLLTTVGDLLLWNENFSHPKVGGPELVRAQQTPATLRNGRKITYAAGLSVSTFDGLPEVSHGGATGGYRTWLGRYPDQGVSVAVLCNSASANPTGLGRETARLWTGAAAQAHASTYAADPAKSEALAGMYRKIRDNTVLELHWRNGKLTLDSERNLEPLAPGKFVAAGSEREFDFEEGTPVRLRVVTQTDDIRYERVEPARPSALELAALIGEYESHETGTTLVVALDSKNELSYRIGLSAPVTLRPTFRDSFATASGSSIYFIRDSSGKVTALSAGEDRVWDLRFTRVR
jgi:CubicO group peptidase (beta-lactamase class C family)